MSSYFILSVFVIVHVLVQFGNAQASCYCMYTSNAKVLTLCIFSNVLSPLKMSKTDSIMVRIIFMMLDV